MGFNTVNAGTIAAVITLDNSKFTAGVNSSLASLTKFADTSNSLGTRVTYLGRGIESLGMTMTKLVSVPVAGAMIASMAAVVRFESAMTGVAKTANLTDEELADLSKGIMDMSEKIPMTTTELAGIAEVAGQLGIKTGSIEKFTAVMANMATATNMTAEEAATQLARFANIVQMSQNDFDRLGSVVVDLGNNFATTEAEISEAGQRIAGAGKLVRMSEADIMAIAAAYTSLGINVEAGGTAISRVLRDIETQVQTNGNNLSKFAEVAGMSVRDFKDAWTKDSAGTFDEVVKGLNRVYTSGGNVIQTLQDMGMNEIRVTDAMSRLATSGTVLSDALVHANNAWADNTALQTEAERRYATTESQIKLLGNQVNVLGIQFGNMLLPAVRGTVDGLRDLLNWIENLDSRTKQNIVTFGKFVVLLGPLTLGIGKVATTVGGLIKAYEMASAGTAIFNTSTGLLGKTMLSTKKVVDTFKVQMALYKMEQAAASVSTTANTVATGANTGATAVNTGAKVANNAVTVAGTVATRAATVAQAAFAAAASINPLVWIGVAVAGLVALATWIAASSEKQENLTATTEKQQEKVDSLNVSYNEAVEKFGEGSDEARKLKAELDAETESLDNNRQTMDELTASCDEAADSSSDVRDSLGKTRDEMDTSIGKALVLSEQVKEFAGSADRSAASTELAKAQLSQLNELVPDLNMSYGELVGNVEDSKSRIDESVEAWSRYQEADYYLKQFSDTMSANIGVSDRLKKVQENLRIEQETLNTEQERYNEASKNSSAAIVPMGNAFREASENASALKDEEAKLSEEQKKNNAAIEDAKTKYAETAIKIKEMEASETNLSAAVNAATSEMYLNKYGAEAVKKAADDFGLSEEELQAKIDNVNKSMEHTTDTAIVEMKDALLNSGLTLEQIGGDLDVYATKLSEAGMSAEDFTTGVNNMRDQVQNAFEAIKLNTEVTFETVKQTLSSNIESSQRWSTSLKEIYAMAGEGASQDFLSYLSTLPIEYAPLLEEIAGDTTGGKLAEFETLWRQAGEQSSTSFLESLGYLPAGLSEALDGVAGEVEEATNEIGKAFPEGLSTGVEEMTPIAIAASKRLALDSVDATAEAAEVNSPSRATMRTGVFMGQGLAMGIEQSSPLVVSAIEDTVSSAINIAGNSNGSWQGIGVGIVSSMVQGISSMSGFLSGTMSGMFSSAVSTARSITVSGFQSAGAQSAFAFSVSSMAGLNSWRAQATALLMSTMSFINVMSTMQMIVAGTSAANGYGSGFSSSFSSVTSMIKALVMSAAMSASATSYVSFYSAGSFAGSGFRNGLESQRASIVSTASSIASAAARAMKDALKEQSPSRVTRKIGEYAGIGLERGILSTEKAVVAASKRLAEASVPDVSYSSAFRAASSAAGLSYQSTPSNVIDYEALGASVASAIVANGGDSSNGANAVAAKMEEFGSGIIDAISNMSVSMDGKPVGNIVTGTVDKNLGRIEAKKRRGF